MRRAALVGTASAAAVLLLAGPALAHITVTPDSAQAGSAAVLTFHAPNEEAKANTVKVDVRIPTAHPIAQLLVKPVPGWSISVKTITLAKPVTTDDGTFNSAVSEVIWSGGQIRPGQFQDFTISADPLPQGISKLVFKAIQTYSNGDVVRWIDLQQPGQPEPDHPAPTLTLTTGSQAPAAAVSSSTASGGSSTDGMARVLGIAGIVVALLAGLVALTVARRRPAGPGNTPAGAANGQPGDRAQGGSKAAGRQVPAGTKASAKRGQSRRGG
ncbi:MAG TPA: YcnI family protein [Streptosporangiaceae bacterium]